MKLGYNTNGFAFHRWQDGIELLAEIGYRAVALTIDHACLDPLAADLSSQLDDMRQLLERHQLASCIETGARFLLNPREKHEPSLLSATENERRVRIEFLKRCIDIASELNSDAVSFWSGVLRDSVSEETAMDRLVEGCREIADYAAQKNVDLAFEPEPGMFIERLEQFDRLSERIAASHFGLTIDIGHVHCVEDTPIPDVLRDWAALLFNVHIEDMKRGVHDHLRFGEGEIDFTPVLRALQEIGYTNGVYVELSRHGHIAPEVMQESHAFLTALLATA